MFKKLYNIFKNYYGVTTIVVSTMAYAIVLLYFYFRSNLPLDMIYENSETVKIFFYLLVSSFLAVLTLIVGLYIILLLILPIIFCRLLTMREFKIWFFIVLGISTFLTILEFAKIILFTPFFAELYLEIHNSPKVFKSENGHFFTVFTEKDNVYKGYDLNKSLNNSSKRCEEILKLKDNLPSVFIYQLINKQTDDNYTIPYNISKIDGNLTQIEFEDALSSIQSYCRERGK